MPRRMKETLVGTTAGYLGVMLIGVLIVAIIAYILLGLIAKPVKGAERPGDVIELTCVGRDSIGVPTRPTVARLIVCKDGAPFDTSKTLAGGGITRYGNLLKARYLIPTSTADSARFTFWARLTVDGLDDLVTWTPSSITVSDLWTEIGDSTSAVIDSTDGGGIYSSGGTPLTNAAVYVTREANASNVLGFGYSTLGNYEIRIPVNRSAADTVYVSSWYQNQWLSTYTQVIIP